MLPVKNKVERRGSNLVRTDLVDGEGKELATEDEVDAAVGAAAGVGQSQAFPKTSAGVTELLAAVAFDRIIMGHVVVDEVFANNLGAQPTFKIGETGTAEKFLAASELTNAAAGTRIPFAGKLLAGNALIVTATAATSDATGGITVTAATSLVAA